MSDSPFAYLGTGPFIKPFLNWLIKGPVRFLNFQYCKMLRDDSRLLEQSFKIIQTVRRSAEGQAAACRDLSWQRDQPPRYTALSAELFESHGIMRGIEGRDQPLFLFSHFKSDLRLRPDHRGGIHKGLGDVIHIGDDPHLELFLKTIIIKACSASHDRRPSLLKAP